MDSQPDLLEDSGGNGVDLAEDTLAFKNMLLRLVLIVFNFASKFIPTLLHMLWVWEDDF